MHSFYQCMKKEQKKRNFVNISDALKKQLRRGWFIWEE